MRVIKRQHGRCADKSNKESSRSALIDVHPAACMCEDENDPSQMLDSRLGASSGLVARRLPTLRRQLFHSTTAKGGKATVGQAGGGGRFWQKPGGSEASPHGTSTRSTVNFHKVGKPKRAAGYWKRRQLRFVNGCKDFPFETKGTQKHTQTGQNMSPLLDEGTNPPPPPNSRGRRVMAAYLTCQDYIFMRRKRDIARLFHSL